MSEAQPPSVQAYVESHPGVYAIDPANPEAGYKAWNPGLKNGLEAILDPQKAAEKRALADEYAHRYDSVPNAEANKAQYPHFPGREEVRARVAEKGLFNITDKPETGDLPALHFGVSLESRVVREAFKGTDEQLADVLRSDSLSLDNPDLSLPVETHDGIVAQATEDAIDRMTNKIGKHNLWWEHEGAKLDKDLADGRISEYYEFTHGEHKVGLINADRPLTEAEVKSIGDMIDRLARKTEGRVFDKLKLIALQHNDRFLTADGTTDQGKAVPNLGLVRLNTIIRDLNKLYDPSKEDPFHVAGEDPLAEVLAHEVGHLFDPEFDPNSKESTAQHKFNQLETGFEVEEEALVFHSIFDLLGKEDNENGAPVKPSREIFVRDAEGREQKVRTHEHFTADELANDIPVSVYAEKNRRERFAEGFLATVVGEPGTVGAMSTALIDYTVHTLNGPAQGDYDPTQKVGYAKRSLAELPTDIPVPSRKQPIIVKVRSTKGWSRVDPALAVFGIKPNIDEGTY